MYISAHFNFLTSKDPPTWPTFLSTPFKPSRPVSIISGGIFDIDAKIEEIATLEQNSTNPDFWNDNLSAQKVLKRIKELKRTVEPWSRASGDVNATLELYEMAKADKDTATIAELAEGIPALKQETDTLEFIRKLSGEDDASPAILTVHSGAGGTESQDWADMLFRMYCRWLERRKMPYTILDFQEGEEAGLKSATLQVDAEYAYGHLKAEVGVHRLVRISPFDSNARRHTSFASIYSYPVFEEDIDFDIPDDDIRVDTYRAGGAGGQHVNKTDSAVRMTHLPTNIVVQCQNERSQLKNRDVAIKLLKARVRQHYKEEEAQKRADKMVDKKKIEWGSQIRSYVLHPYNMVKDLRTDVETSNTQGVLDGDIDQFIEAYLLQF